MVYSSALAALLMMAAQVAPPSDGDVLHLLQLAVPIDRDMAEAFGTVTSAIRSCEEARQLGWILNAQIVENRSVPLSILPQGIRILVRDLPTGRATPVFGKAETTMKVLVICARKSGEAEGDTAI
jgi:hypothetical protein